MALKIMGYAIKQSQKILVSRNKNDTLEFVSSIEYSGPRGISITLPLRNQMAMEVKRGEEVYLKVPANSFIMGFKARVRSFTWDNVVLVNLEQPAEFERIQRRSHFRLKTLLNVEIGPFSEDGQDPGFTPATALDISAGGMEVMTATPYQKDSFLIVKFNLELNPKTVYNFRLKARVRRFIQESHRKFKLGLEFVDLSRSDNDRIVKYIFRKSVEKEYWRK